MERRLYKSRQNRQIAGVCGGIGEYFNIDPVIVRLLVVVFTLLGAGAGLIGYIIGAIIIPERDDYKNSDSYVENYEFEDGDGHPESGHRRSNGSSLLILGIILLALGAFVIVRSFTPWIPGEAILAAILIALGIYFVVRRK